MISGKLLKESERGTVVDEYILQYKRILQLAENECIKNVRRIQNFFSY